MSGRRLDVSESRSPCHIVALISSTRTGSAVLSAALIAVILSGCSNHDSPVEQVSSVEHEVTTPPPETVIREEPQGRSENSASQVTTPAVESSPQAGGGSDTAAHPRPAASVAEDLPSGADGAGNVTRVRLPDDRPPLNEIRLSSAGIQVYRSRRLVLLTDVATPEVRRLPMLADLLFEALEHHFGTLPPSADGSDFQVTGHLIQDRKKFEAAGLMPSSAFTFDHGRHLNYRFWMFDSPHTYYRRHLLLHEFTHCFMTCECGMQNVPPLWYLEGMAEYFATHRIRSAGAGKEFSAEFGVLPDGEEGFDGWGRIAELRRSFLQRAATPSHRLQIPSLVAVMPAEVSVFRQNLQYARSWALCWLIQTHPLYQKAFRPLAKTRTRVEFLDALSDCLPGVQARLQSDWLLTIETLREGFDVQRSFPVHADDRIDIVRPSRGVVQLPLKADADWQDTGVTLQPATSVDITCEGRCVVHRTSEPWDSEPQGISIEYYRGRPLGEVMGILVAAEGDFVSARFPVGRHQSVSVDAKCRLWMQVNDSSASRADNSGSISVRITASN